MPLVYAGATGVELAAELHNTIREFVSFGLDRINPERDIRITIVEAAPKILPALTTGAFNEMPAAIHRPRAPGTGPSNG